MVCNFTSGGLTARTDMLDNMVICERLKKDTMAVEPTCYALLIVKDDVYEGPIEYGQPDATQQQHSKLDATQQQHGESDTTQHNNNTANLSNQHQNTDNKQLRNTVDTQTQPTNTRTQPKIH